MRLLADILTLFFIIGGAVHLFHLYKQNKSVINRIEKLEDKTKDLLSND